MVGEGRRAFFQVLHYAKSVVGAKAVNVTILDWRIICITFNWYAENYLLIYVFLKILYISSFFYLYFRYCKFRYHRKDLTQNAMHATKFNTLFFSQFIFEWFFNLQWMFVADFYFLYYSKLFVGMFKVYYRLIFRTNCWQCFMLCFIYFIFFG